jgi:nitrate reductase beta subunit
MVWYVPPMSPVVNAVMSTGGNGDDHRDLFGAIDQMRIPIEYLAGLLSGGQVAPVEESLKLMAAMRSHMRLRNLGGPAGDGVAATVGRTGRELEDLYRLLAIAKYEERYVIPIAHGEGGDGRRRPVPSIEYAENPVRTEGAAQ